MSNPTLRALAGLPAQPASLADSTLVLIDCQNTYTQGVMELEGVQAALDEAAGLLDRARAAGIPIIHIQHDDGPGSLYDIRGESGAIVPRVAPREGAPVVVAAATATRALPSTGGTAVPASVTQSAGLAAMADLFAVVVPDTEAIPD